MEKLHELHQEGKYDLLVLDTPPTRNALDFLDAPRRLARFIDSRSLSFFRTSSKLGFGLLGRGSGMVFSVMKRATGVDLLKDLADFFNSFGDMADGFRERADRVNALIADHRTTFLLVTSPRAASIEEAAYFHRKLRNEDLPFGGVIVNRMREPVKARPGPKLEQELAGLLDDKLAGKVNRTRRGAPVAGRARRREPRAPAAEDRAQADDHRARAPGRRARPGRAARHERASLRMSTQAERGERFAALHESGMLRDAEPLGRRLGEAAGRRRLRGAGHHELGLRLDARARGRRGHARRRGRARGGAHGGHAAAGVRRPRERLRRSRGRNRAGWPRPARSAARSRTTVPARASTPWTGRWSA